MRIYLTNKRGLSRLGLCSHSNVSDIHPSAVSLDNEQYQYCAKRTRERAHWLRT